MKTIVVTGGSSGVGAETVKRLQTQGHQIYNLDIQPPASSPSFATFVACDLSQQSSIDQAIGQLPHHIHSIANVAGIADAKSPPKVVAVNFFGLRHLTEALIDRMPEGGHIVNVSSIAGRDWRTKFDAIQRVLGTSSMAEGLALLEQEPKIMGRSAYTLSKRLVTAYSQHLVKEVRAKGITVNNVSPGPVATPLYPQFESLLGSEQSDWMIQQAGRQATPEDIAIVIEMLCLTDSQWLNGVDLPVDGGFSAGVESGWIDFHKSPAMIAMKQSAQPSAPH